MEDSLLKIPSNRTSLFYLVEISKSIDQLKKKLKEKNRNIEGSDLHIFKELCTNSDPKISSTACNIVIDFVKSNSFPANKALTWFIVILQSDSGNNDDGIIQAIADLLLLSDNVNFNLCSPQHPFILFLKQKEQNWNTIEFQMSRMWKSKRSLSDRDLFSVLTPLFKYILWSPPATTNFMCKRGAWKFFVDNFCSEHLKFLIQTICWLPSNHPQSILDVDHLFRDYESFDKKVNENNLQDIMCVYYAYASCKLAKYGHDPALTLEKTKTYLKQYPGTTDIVLIQIAQTLIDCPAPYLNVFLLTCVELIEHNGYGNITVLWLLISSILPWLIHSLAFIEDVHRTAERLFAIVDDSTKTLKKRSTSRFIPDGYFMQVISSEEEMFWAYVVANALESSNHEQLLNRISGICFSREEIVKHPLLNLCISAIFLSNEVFNVQTKALDVLMNINPGFQLPLMLYMLAKARDPKLKLKLLHSLPLTAVEKDNVSPVLRTIDSLFSSGKRIVKFLSIELYIILWKNEERCYSFLHDRLLEFKDLPQEHIWETDIVLVSAIRNICTRKPEKYGKEWISILNEIIKRWHKKKDSSLPSTLALDAILMLCKAEILEVTGIYELLSERLFEDKRVEVSKKFYALIEYMFENAKKETFEEELDKNFLHAITKLWLIISSPSSEKEIILAAMSAMSKFDKNRMPLKVVPAIYRKYVKLPSSFAKTPIDAARQPEDVLKYVPGDVWIHFLKNIHQDIKPEACNMLIHWLREEVENFPRSYYGSIRGEPKDLSFLHNGCIYKAFVAYLKTFLKQINSYSENDLEICVMCLKILNGNLSKTLPLHNWSFLLELLEIEYFPLTKEILILFAKQSPTSSSARICIEDYLKNFDVSKKENELKVLLNAMTDLSCGVSTVVLKKFLESCKDYIIDNLMKGDKNLFIFMCDHFKETLKNSEIDDNNRICISELLETFWEEISSDNDVFPKLIDVSTELPITFVEHLCSPSVMWEISSEKVRKLLKLRCAMALRSSHEDPFVWLQESVEATTNYLEEQDLYFECSLEIIKKYRLHSNSWQWLLQYMSFIHSSIHELSEGKINFIFDVFIFNVVNLSIYEPFVSNNFSMEESFLFFPQALKSITSNEISAQVIEWLQFMSNSSRINEKYRVVFYNGILSLKNSVYLSSASTWCKILS